MNNLRKLYSKDGFWNRPAVWPREQMKMKRKQRDYSVRSQKLLYLLLGVSWEQDSKVISSTGLLRFLTQAVCSWAHK